MFWQTRNKYVTKYKELIYFNSKWEDYFFLEEIRKQQKVFAL